MPDSARHVLASAASGALGVTALAPLEVVRVNMVTGRQSLRSAVASLRAGWFRGNGADVLAASARIGITMPAFRMYKNLLMRMSNLDESLTPPSWVPFVAGALAGCTATVICFPLEVVRTRLAVSCELLEKVDGGVIGCVQYLAASEGLLALYGGLTTTLAGVLPFNAIKLSSYDVLRERTVRLVASAEPQQQTSSKAVDHVSLPLSATAAIGAFSGVLAATSCFPLEVVRRRQMMGEYAGLSIIGALPRMVRAEGVSVLLVGARLNIFKVALGNSLGFVLYEAAKDVLMVGGRRPPWEKRDAIC